MELAAVRDLRQTRRPAGLEELAAFETDVLAGFVLARAAAGLSDATISSDVLHLEQVRGWFGRPLWEMEPPDADSYFGRVLRSAAPGTRLSRAQAVKTYFVFLELRHKVELHALTGRVVECPIDEMNRPRGRHVAALRIPPTEPEMTGLFAGWRSELTTCRKFAPTARNYAAARLMADVGLRVNEARSLDLADVKWELGRFGKLHVRHGKGTRGSGPRERMVPLINEAGQTPALVRRGRVGPLRRRPHPARRPAVSLGTQERRRFLRPRRRRGAAGRARRSRRSASSALDEHAHPARPAPLLRQPALPARDGPAGDSGAAWALLGGHHDALRPRAPHPRRGRLVGRAGPRRAATEGTDLMRWNLRLAAAQRGIWKASELHRRLAEHGLVISAGKMSGLWSGQPVSVKLDDLDVICAVLGCGVEELLLPEPDKVHRPRGEEATQAVVGAPAAVTPKRRDGRTLPPP